MARSPKGSPLPAVDSCSTLLSTPQKTRREGNFRIISGGDWCAEAAFYGWLAVAHTRLWKGALALTNNLRDRLNQCSGFSRPVDSQAVAVSVLKGFDGGRDLQHGITHGGQSKAAVGGTE